MWFGWTWTRKPATNKREGHRPALVLSNSAFNRRMGLAFVCPITTRPKGIPFEVPVPAGVEVTGVILCQHAKTIDWRARRVTFKCRLDDETVNEVTGRVLSFIDPDGIFCGEPLDAG